MSGETIRRLEMPRWGLSMEEGTLNQWLIAEGDSFSAGDEIAEIESSKIANVFEAHFDGTLRRRVVAEGETVPVGALIGLAADPAVPEAELDAYLAAEAQTGATAPQPEPPDGPAEGQTDTAEGPSAGAGSAPPQPVAEAEAASAAVMIPESLRLAEGSAPDPEAVTATHHAMKFARTHRVDLRQIRGSDRRGRVTRADIEAAVEAAGGRVPRRGRVLDPVSPGHTGDDVHVPATPLARRLARRLGVNLNDVVHRDPRGRVCKADVEAWARRRAPGSDLPSPGAAADPARPAHASAVRREGETVPLSATRRTIARRLQASKQSAPHYRLSADVRVDALMRMREELNETRREARVSVNDFLVKACAGALLEVPECNATFDGETLRRFPQADIAVAVATGEGLLTPVLHEVERTPLLELSGRMRELARRAKEGALRHDEIEGGTLTVSNLGMFGVQQFDAIINPPQCAIVAAGRVRQEPVVAADGGDARIVVGAMLNVTMSCDHRVIDGALGARFLQALEKRLLQPALILA